MRGLSRALLARCPVCGSKDIWANFGETVDACPGCAYEFSREEGYWTGGLIVAMAFVLILFFAVFVGGMLLFWPDVPWDGLLIASMLVIGVAPFALYRQSKMLWVWVDQHVHPYTRAERDWEDR